MAIFLGIDRKTRNPGMDLKKPPLQETHCHWPSDSKILNFFKPIPFEENEIDKKLLLSAEEFDIPFEGQVLKGYRWGKGRSVLLVHGWSSRASHMAFLARHLAKCGFSVTKEIPINTARAMIAGHSHVQLVETSGEGHRRILVSKSLLQAIAYHLTVQTSRIENARRQ